MTYNIPFAPAAPKGWCATQVKYHYVSQLGKMLQNDAGTALDREVPYLKAQHVRWKEVVWIEPPTMWASPSDLSQYGIHAGDLLVCEGGEVGRSGIVQDPPERCIIQNALHRVRSTKACTSYLMYWLHHVDGAGWFDVLCNKATIAHLTSDKLGALPLLLPPLETQRRIAAFLDRKTAALDALIDKKQRLVALLQEKRQALITHAVTKGLNPKAPMKDSGIPWIGEIPAHWEISRLRHLGRAWNGLTYSPSDIVDGEDEASTPVLRSNNIQDGVLDLDGLVHVGSHVPDRFLLAKNDLFICSRNGSRRLIGKNALITEKAEGFAFGAFMMVFRGESNHFVRWVLNSSIFEVQSTSFLTSTINQLTVGNIYSFQVACPPPSEMKAIAEHLSALAMRLDRQLENLRESTAKLHEYRQALISAAVTGQIDPQEIAE